MFLFFFIFTFLRLCKRVIVPLSLSHSLQIFTLSLCLVHSVSPLKFFIYRLSAVKLTPATTFSRQPCFFSPPRYVRMSARTISTRIHTPRACNHRARIVNAAWGRWQRVTDAGMSRSVTWTHLPLPLPLPPPLLAFLLPSRADMSDSNVWQKDENKRDECLSTRLS